MKYTISSEVSFAVFITPEYNLKISFWMLLTRVLFYHFINIPKSRMSANCRNIENINREDQDGNLLNSLIRELTGARRLFCTTRLAHAKMFVKICLIHLSSTGPNSSRGSGDCCSIGSSKRNIEEGCNGFIGPVRGWKNFRSTVRVLFARD